MTGHGGRRSTARVRSRRNGHRGATALHGVLLVGAVILALPFAYAATRALMTPAQAIAFPVEWVPDSLDPSSFTEAIDRLGWRSFLNSTILAVCAIVGRRCSV